jgi:hypothetical protein
VQTTATVEKEARPTTRPIILPTLRRSGCTIDSTEEAGGNVDDVADGTVGGLEELTLNTDINIIDRRKRIR